MFLRAKINNLIIDIFLFIETNKKDYYSLEKSNIKIYFSNLLEIKRIHELEQYFFDIRKNYLKENFKNKIFFTKDKINELFDDSFFSNVIIN